VRHSVVALGGLTARAQTDHTILAMLIPFRASRHTLAACLAWKPLHELFACCLAGVCVLIKHEGQTVVMGMINARMRPVYC